MCNVLFLQELALPIIDNEIFGEVAEAKEVAQFAMNYKEAKKVCADVQSSRLLCASRFDCFDRKAQPLTSSLLCAPFKESS